MPISWIGRFALNPQHQQEICPGFYRLRHLAPCEFSCAYCFVRNATFSRFGFPAPITEADLGEMERAVGKWLIANTPLTNWNETELIKQSFPSLILNAGELGDSFSPDIAVKASLRLIELFRRQDRHTLLLVTKSNRVAEILREAEPTDRVILSLSIGSNFYGAQKFGPTWPNGLENLGKCWRIRLRLDPLIDVSTAKEIAWVYQYLRPERITLGTLRATTANYRAMSNGTDAQRALAALLTKDPNGGSHPWRLPVEQRVGIYRKAMEDLRGLSEEIGICKETREVFEMLGLEPEKNLCNCVG